MNVEMNAAWKKKQTTKRNKRSFDLAGALLGVYPRKAFHADDDQLLEICTEFVIDVSCTWKIPNRETIRGH